MSDDKIEQLEDSIGRHDCDLAAFKKFAYGLADDDTDDLIDAVTQALECVETLEQRLDDLDDVSDMLADLTEQKTSNEAKISAVVQYAANTRRDN